MKTSRKPDEGDKAKGRELARRRQEANMSQEEVANTVGISARQLSKYELGQNRIPAGRYEALMNMLREQLDGGFAESQAGYRSPAQERDALLRSIGQLKSDLNSLHHKMQDQLTLCLEIVGRL